MATALRVAPGLKVLTLSTSFVDLLNEDTKDDSDDETRAGDEDDDITTVNYSKDAETTCTRPDAGTLCEADEDGGTSDARWTPLDIILQPCAVWAEHFLDTYLQSPGLNQLRFFHESPVDAPSAAMHGAFQLICFAQRCITEPQAAGPSYLIRYRGIVEDGPVLDEVCFWRSRAPR